MHAPSRTKGRRRSRRPVLEGKVRHGVVDPLVDHPACHQPAHVAGLLRRVRVIGHLHDAHVLVVDDLHASVEIVLPDQ